MNKRSLAALVVAAMMSGSAYGVTGNTVVFDDADENGFNHAAAACGSSFVSFESDYVHGGTTAVAVARIDNNGIGWAGPGTYSTNSDYDGVVFWFNAGNSTTTVTSLGVYDHQGGSHFLHLEDIYGGPLPAATWLRFDIPFSSPYFAANSSTAPANFDWFCIINHSAGSMSQFMYVDDVTLTGADIFKDSFELVPQ